MSVAREAAGPFRRPGGSGGGSATTLRSFLAAALLAAGCLAPAGPALAGEDGRALTAGGHAWAEVRKATRKDGVLHVEVQFLTDYSGYSGEKIYDAIPADRLDASVYVSAGDQTFPLWREGGVAALPDRLELAFNYDPGRNPRVGKWAGDFVAPGADVSEVVLHLPNVAPLGPFPVRDR